MDFRGSKYRILELDRGPQDPSWFTFVDEADVRDREWRIGPGDVVIDIGSAYGSYALTAMASGASFVHCWNPVASENEVLAANLEMNGWASSSAVHGGGLYSKTGYLRESDQSFSETEADGHFPVTSLDEACPVLPEGRLWLKVDVEGAEVEVLRGARRLIGERRPIVLVENHQFKNPAIQETVRALMCEDHGYSQESCVTHHQVVHTLYRP